MFSAVANARDLLDEALRLPDDEREQLAWALLDSVHGPAEEGAAEAWTREIQRRLDDLRSGRSRGRSWEDVEASLRARLERK